MTDHEILLITHGLLMNGIPVTVGGKRWTLQFKRLDKEYGRCDPPDQRAKKITLSPSIRKDNVLYMETVLHEILHAACWNLAEEVVTDYAFVAAKTLHRLGFRLVEDPDGKNNPE
jgi:hypothetical protein